MGILFRRKLARKINKHLNTITYCGIFATAAAVFTASALMSGEKVEYVVDEPSTYVIDISGLSVDSLAAAEKATEKTAETKKVVTEETTSALKKDVDSLDNYKGIFMTNSSGNLNVREAADMGADVVGVLEEGNGGKVLQYGKEWTKVESGEVIGYVATGYIAFGDTAQKILKENGYTAVVEADTLMVRAEKSTESEVLGMVGTGETFKCTELTKDWVQINYDGQVGYLSRQFVSLDTIMTYAKTIGEIEEQIRAEAESIAAEQASIEAQREAESRAEAESIAAEQAAAAVQEQADGSWQEEPAYEEKNNQYEPVTEASRTAPTSYDDAYLLACLVACEAGNQPYEGKLAVANVVLNRVASGAYPNTIEGVIYQSGQFGPAYTSLPGMLANGPDSESQAAANAALSGNNIVPSYLSFGLVGTIDTKNLNTYKNIGAHTFY